MALNQFIDSGIVERYNRSIDPNEFDFVGRAMERKKQQQAAELNQLRILAEQDAMRQAQEEAEAYQISAQDDALPQLKRRGTKAATTLAGKLELDAEVRAGRETKRKADEADAAKSDAESKRKTYEYHIGGVTRFQSPEDIRQHLADGVVKGAYSMEEATAMMRSAPKTAEEIPAWRDSLLRSTLAPKDQVVIGSREEVSANVVAQRAEAARNAHEARLQQLIIAAQNAKTKSEEAAFKMLIEREKLEIQRLKAAGGGSGGGGASSDGGMPPGGTPGNRPPQGKRFKPDGTLEVIPGGEAAAKPLPQKVVQELREARGLADNMDRLERSFSKSYGGMGVVGFGADIERGISEKLGKNKNAVQWWKEYDSLSDLKERNALFGATLTANENAAWQLATVGPRSDPEIIKTNLAIRAKIAKDVIARMAQDYSAAGYGSERVNAIAATGSPVRVNSPDEARKLPKGTKIILPDGREGVVP